MRTSDNSLALALAILVAIGCNSLDRSEPVKPVTVSFAVDTTSLVRNPVMGWVLYEDACGDVSKAADYWTAQGTAAQMFGSIFYWRSRWSELEPQEGVYAWDTDENFKALIQGAKDRGLKLAFRVIVDSKDHTHQATPDFVRLAGAKGYESTFWTPYADDPVFQEKFGNFVKAFAKRFDNPDEVDFIDAYGLGWWGEGHHIGVSESGDKSDVYDWITGLYGTAFNKVILVTNFGSEVGFGVEKILAIRDRGYIIRRDSMGSQWFLENDIRDALSVFPAAPLIAESCYWGGCQDSYTPWSSDIVYKDKYTTWVDFYKQSYADAIRARANTLDLRQQAETRGWTRRARNLVDSFVVKGGYRFTPVTIEYPEKVKASQQFVVRHIWKNSGVGVCPNANPRWNYKYKVAFSLLNSDDSLCSVCLVPEAEPSGWLAENDGEYSSKVSFDVKDGDYCLAVGLVDTSKDTLRPSLNLAVRRGDYVEGWLKIGNIQITK